ncbi:hypothetical protein D1007_25779 [Hordeum vulgare]|nr:hypothetical protein D1007_25779 [Hordeum vulgare]
MVGLPYGSWEGSVMTDEHLDDLQQKRKLPSTELVEARAPGGEHVSEPRAGEHVVFGTHFLVVFGLPESAFLWQFLEFYGLQIHHLGPNSVLYLACFAMLCEPYLGSWPFPSFFRHFFHFCAQAHHSVPYSYGSAVVYRRRAGRF